MMNRRNVLMMAGLPLARVMAQKAPFATLPKLGYAVDALEPFVDAKTMEIHHGKHHQAYVDNLNKALATVAQPLPGTVEELLGQLNQLPEGVRTAVRNNGGGHANHSLFWRLLKKNAGAPKGELARAIDAAFGSRSGLEDKLKAAGLGQFGSGWAWITIDGQKRLAVEATPNQDSPLLVGKKPLLGIDVWEHAYYLKYQNRRADYLTGILQVVDWDFVSARYVDLTK